MEMTFTKALVQYLKRDGESLTDFRHEIGRLTPQDKSDLRRDFAAMGVEIIESPTN